MGAKNTTNTHGKAHGNSCKKCGAARQKVVQQCAKLYELEVSLLCDIQPFHLMPLIYTFFFVFEPLFTCFSGARMNMHSMTLEPQYINRTFSMCLRYACECIHASMQVEYSELGIVHTAH